MKLKKLTKKIRLLEARLQKGAKRLAKLKRKLGAATKTGLSRSKKKSTARPRSARRAGGSSITIPKKGRRLTTKPQVGAAKTLSAAKKVKRKLNLSPERRAQLAAAMKARWAAKRAAVEANPQDTSTSSSLDFTLGQASQAP
jgi:hypothetical protein